MRTDNLKRRIKNSVLKITVLYTLFGFLWILFSDKIVAYMVTDMDSLTHLQTYKGWFYVTITAGLIGYLVWEQLDKNAKIELDLRKSEERLKLALEGANDGLWDYKPRNGEIYFSPRWFTMLGYSPEIFSQKYETWLELMHPDDSPEAEKKLNDFLQNKDEYYTAEFRMRAKDGRWIWISTRGKAVEWNDDGEITRMVGTHTDISQSKNAAEEIKKLNLNLENRVKERTLELEALNQELESFSYSVSHDLKTPLRAIEGFSDALLEDYGASLEGDAKKLLQRVCKASSKMAELIDSLLDLSRVTRLKMNIESVNLSAIANEIIEDLKKEAPERKFQYTIKSDLFVNGDRNLLGIVLTNLLGNAWKFTGDCAETKIEFGNIGVNGTDAYYVKDNGAGFDKNYADKLFIPFQRLHSDKEFKGTGIGLSTVQRIIHRHGGQIWAEAEVGKGATFYFTLHREFKDSVSQNPKVETPLSQPSFTT